MLRIDRYDSKDNNLILTIDNKDRHKVTIQNKKGDIIWIYRDVYQIKSGTSLLRKGRHLVKNWTQKNGNIEITYKN